VLKKKKALLAQRLSSIQRANAMCANDYSQVMPSGVANVGEAPAEAACV
jgi:hypothetical protein